MNGTAIFWLLMSCAIGIGEPPLASDSLFFHRAASSVPSPLRPHARVQHEAVGRRLAAGISWAGFWCQSVVSATTYTVVGVMNKMLTVTVNVLIWDKHASPAGVVSLCVCLLGGFLYQEPPLRDGSAPSKPAEDVPLTENSSEPDEDSSFARGNKA